MTAKSIKRAAVLTLAILGGRPLIARNGIDYHNGPVIHGGIHIYYIWYGDARNAPPRA
jgi:hypothetical protein